MRVRASLAVVIAFLLTCAADAQDIEAKLAGSTVSSGFTVLDNNSQMLFSVRGNQRVGIGTISPSANLHISGYHGLLATGTPNAGTIPATGAGTRMMWYPKKQAFRAGIVDGTQWDDANIGTYSFASGINVIASGAGSTAMGAFTEATASGAAAFGHNTVAGGLHSFACGQQSIASGSEAFASGISTTASGTYSTAMGANTTASARFATSFGYYTTASGEYSTAIGTRVNTNGKKGCFMIGDASTSTIMNSLYSNRLYARFHNGYILYTKSDRTTGVYAFSGASSWSSLSDSTRKENYSEANGEHMLSRFRALRLGSWNYIGDNQRHYGPMAQEWFAAFGSDGIGMIGNDTTLASADVDGVLCIAVQALGKRTGIHREQLASHEKQILALTAQLAEKDQVIGQLREQLTVSQRENDARYTQLIELVYSLRKEQDYAQHIVH